MRLRYIINILLILVLSSCVVSIGEVVERKQKKLKRMSDAKLYRETVDNYLNYNTINFKKISIAYEEGNRKQEFRGSVRIQKDSVIWLSISKLGIEGMRVKLTPDSVVFIDRLHRKYMETDYSYLNRRFNLELDFFLVQSILTNRLPEYRIGGDLPFFRNFRGKRGAKNYIFFSKRKTERKYWKMQRKSRGIQGSTLEILRISPDIMRLESIDIFDTEFFTEDKLQRVRFNLKYQNYKMYNEKSLFPEKVITTVERDIVNNSERKRTASEKIVLTITINKMEVDPEHLSFPFTISSRYKKIDE